MLVELLAAVLILAFCLTGIAMSYLSSFVLTDLARDISLANNAVQAKIEETNRVTFANITAQAGLFNLTAYGFPYANATGRVYVQTDYAGYTNDLTRVRVVACFESRGKLIGDNLTNCGSSPVEAAYLRTR